jgi:L1 cell adhesion molecule like protein
MLNVSAKDKGTGKEQKIRIEAGSGLTKEDIEKMVADAEKYKAEDELAGQRIASKNALESYAYNLRNTLNDEKVSGKIDALDRVSLVKSVDDTIAWLDRNQEAEKEEYEDKQKELEKIANPIMTKMYGGAGGAPGGFPSGSTDQTQGPTVEEVD